MSEHTGELVSVKIIPNDKGNPPGKLADAEVIFEADAGPLSGLKLIGFSVWERRGGGKNVTFPARQYSVNGERRSYALLRPSKDDHDAQAIRAPVPRPSCTAGTWQICPVRNSPSCSPARLLGRLGSTRLSASSTAIPGA